MARRFKQTGKQEVTFKDGGLFSPLTLTKVFNFKDKTVTTGVAGQYLNDVSVENFDEYKTKPHIQDAKKHLKK